MTRQAFDFGTGGEMTAWGHCQALREAPETVRRYGGPLPRCGRLSDAAERLDGQPLACGCTEVGAPMAGCPQLTEAIETPYRLRDGRIVVLLSWAHEEGVIVTVGGTDFDLSPSLAIAIPADLFRPADLDDTSTGALAPPSA